MPSYEKSMARGNQNSAYKDRNLEFLEEYASRDGVKVMFNGVMYREITKGKGDKPTPKAMITVHYTGKLINGKVFDSNRWADMSEERKRMAPEGKDSPIEFPLNRVIKGWTEGMKFIGKGGRITLWIPAELAYGERGAGESIGPNEALCFDVELISVTNK